MNWRGSVLAVVFAMLAPCQESPAQMVVRTGKQIYTLQGQDEEDVKIVGKALGFIEACDGELYLSELDRFAGGVSARNLPPEAALTIMLNAALVAEEQKKQISTPDCSQATLQHHRDTITSVIQR